MESWRQRRANQIVIVTMALLGGVAMGQLGVMLPGVLAVTLMAFVLVMLRLRLGLVALCIFGLGGWRGATTTFSHTLPAAQVGHTVTLVGTISDDPSINPKNQVSYTLGNVQMNGRPTHQSVQVLTFYKVLQRGYRVEVTGKLTPDIGAIPVELAFAPTTVLSTRTSWLERWRQGFFAGLRAVLPEPLSGFGLGLLVGVRAMIDKSLQQTLNAVGLSHLIAVSGYNLTIMIQAVRRVLVRGSHFIVTALSLWLIVGFLVVAGFSASIVRAAMVSVLGLLVAYYGYAPRPLTLVALPAALTVAWRPTYLLHDAGWQLSFLAFLGIVVLAPLLQQRFVRRPTTLKLLVVESLAAQIVTAPLILGIFGNFSIVSPLSNAVILPFVPLAMLLSFGAGSAAMVLPALAGWVALPAAGLLGLMVGLIQWFATWPYANLQLSATPAMVAGMYGLIGLATLVLWRQSRLYVSSSLSTQPDGDII